MQNKVATQKTYIFTRNYQFFNIVNNYNGQFWIRGRTPWTFSLHFRKSRFSGWSKFRTIVTFLRKKKRNVQEHFRENTKATFFVSTLACIDFMRWSYSLLASLYHVLCTILQYNVSMYSLVEHKQYFLLYYQCELHGVPRNFRSETITWNQKR